MLPRAPSRDKENGTKRKPGGALRTTRLVGLLVSES